jgi:hypothetical protein
VASGYFIQSCKSCRGRPGFVLAVAFVFEQGQFIFGRKSELWFIIMEVKKINA